MNAKKSATRPGLSVATFVDPEDRTVFEDHEREDVHGVSLIGFEDEDEHGPARVWWGTERAAWVLAETGGYVMVVGTIRHSRGKKVDWVGHFLGSEEEAIEYAETHGAEGPWHVEWS